MTPNAERAAIAREVLTGLEQHFRADPLQGIGATAATVTRWYRDEHYPPPPAPVTVTVEEKVWTLGAAGEWVTPGSWVASDHIAAKAFHRIAADARRIAELEESERTLKGHLNQVYEELRPVSDGEYLAAELATLAVARIAELEQERVPVGEFRDWFCGEYAQSPDDLIGAWGGCVLKAAREHLLRLRSERDEARRALEEKGTGLTGGVTEHSPQMLQGGAGSTPAQSVPPSPAPIPLGVTVEVEGDPDSPYERVAGGWICESTPRWQRVQQLHKVYTDDDSSWGMVLTALYRARHPIATRETVERVERALRGVRGGLGSSHDWMYAQAARASLTAMGVTIQEEGA